LAIALLYAGLKRVAQLRRQVATLTKATSRRWPKTLAIA
jgi:hypothetical protein